MILIEVGQAIVDEDVVSPVLSPDVLLLDVQRTVAWNPFSIIVALVQVSDYILAHLVCIMVHIAVCVFYGHLLHSSAEVHETSAHGNEGNANDEEDGEDGASCEYGLPGWQSLLLEF